MRQLIQDNYFWTDGIVTLRAVEEGDWEGFYYNRFDTHARRILNYEVELPPTETEAKRFEETFRDFKVGTERIMFTITNQDGQNIGGINLNSIDEKNGTFSIGLQIDRDHRGQGYGTAAMAILLKYAFHERRLNKYYGSIFEGNIGSGAMLLKLGCKEEGRRCEMIYTEGRFHDEILYGLTRTEFEQHRK